MRGKVLPEASNGAGRGAQPPCRSFLWLLLLDWFFHPGGCFRRENLRGCRGPSATWVHLGGVCVCRLCGEVL